MFRGIFPLHPRDVIGVGVVFGRFSNDLRDSQQRAQQLDPNIGVQQRETVVELTYRLSFLRSSLFVQPDLQYIVWPGGTGRISDAFALGAEIGVNF